MNEIKLECFYENECSFYSWNSWMFEEENFCLMYLASNDLWLQNMYFECKKVKGNLVHVKNIEKYSTRIWIPRRDIKGNSNELAM